MSICELINLYLRNSGHSRAVRLEALLEAELESPGAAMIAVLPSAEQTRVAHMAAAAQSYLETPALALEIARNVAVAALDGADVFQASREAIRHRQEHFALRCSDVDCCAMAMDQAWHFGAKGRAA